MAVLIILGDLRTPQSKAPRVPHGVLLQVIPAHELLKLDADRVASL
jgi:hypothetical protein